MEGSGRIWKGRVVFEMLLAGKELVGEEDDHIYKLIDGRIRHRLQRNSYWWVCSGPVNWFLIHEFKSREENNERK